VIWFEEDNGRNVRDICYTVEVIDRQINKELFLTVSLSHPHTTSSHCWELVEYYTKNMSKCVNSKC